MTPRLTERRQMDRRMEDHTSRSEKKRKANSSLFPSLSFSFPLPLSLLPFLSLPLFVCTGIVFCFNKILLTILFRGNNYLLFNTIHKIKHKSLQIIKWMKLI
ncbi:hypothetical protein ACF0H5_023760 [Mactra antiquata]